MSVLTKVEAKGWRGRLFLSLVTLSLILGGLTMLYPFLIMLGGAMRSDHDAADMSPVPKYLYDDAELVRKFLETKYYYNPIVMNTFRQSADYSFRDAAVDLDFNPRAVADLERFMTEADLPDHWQSLGGAGVLRSISDENQRLLVENVRAHYDGDLQAYIADLGVPIPSWWLISRPILNLGLARSTIKDNVVEAEYFKLQRASPPGERALVSLSALFLDRIAYAEFGQRDFEAFRAAYGLDCESYERFTLPQRVPPPERAAFRQGWLNFIFDDHVNLSFVRTDASDADFQAFLQDHFGTFKNFKKYWYDSPAADFGAVRLPADHEWLRDSQREAYKAFLRTQPPESLRLVGPEYLWRDYLATTYDSVAAVAEAHGADYQAWDDVQMPQTQLETAYVLGQAGALRWRYATRNFRIVARQMFVQGRPFMNTIIYVLLSLAFALTLQPMAAYGLSRFQPPGTWKIIFILVATMAFPPMVGMIPKFLLIQKLGLLNTFFALILPVAVNGMLIFLLKGFFDSIPKDLYDAAMIDGASEWRIFWQITMSMSKPILAVVALRTFSAAWMSFMYPLIVCPDERMHVLAVWLQQFQQQAPGTAVFASIIIASFPSLLIFLFAQRIIMRGIAVPSEK
ncbi:MAG: carbohydrate ABC transporter permease [Candidatus Marinimicrobia bacterium]|nr:carbohydrate ABC transporter permease [Candidatus Neomarinimicrobiota bacterium]